MRHLIAVVLSLVSYHISGQIPSSLSDPSTPGVERVFLNPALGVASPYSWDATIIGAHIHGYTDYGFLRSANLLNFANRANDAQVVDLQSAIPESSEVPLVIFDENGGKKKAFFTTRLMGPSVSFSLDDATRVGIFSQYRAGLTSSDIPAGFGFYELNDSYATELIDVDPATISYATWLEVGAHISKQIDNISFGANIKILRANEGGYLESNTDFTYQFIDSVVTTEGQLNYNLGFTNQAIDDNYAPTSFNGSGIGIDIGVNYQSDKGNFGIAIHDIGALQFKTNVESYTSDILAGIEQVRTQDLRDFTDIRDFINNVQSQLDIEPDLFSVFSVGLPTRLTLQGTYYYDDNITIAGQINQRLPFFANSLKATNTVVVSPSFRKGPISIYTPITIYEYSKLRIGTAFRLGPLTIGTDHLTSIFFNHDFKGSDVYMRFTLSPFGTSSGNRSNRSRRSGRDVECPIF